MAGGWLDLDLNQQQLPFPFLHVLCRVLVSFLGSFSWLFLLGFRITHSVRWTLTVLWLTLADRTAVIWLSFDCPLTVLWLSFDCPLADRLNEWLTGWCLHHAKVYGVSDDWVVHMGFPLLVQCAIGIALRHPRMSAQLHTKRWFVILAVFPEFSTNPPILAFFPERISTKQNGESAPDFCMFILKTPEITLKWQVRWWQSCCRYLSSSAKAAWTKSKLRQDSYPFRSNVDAIQTDTSICPLCLGLSIYDRCIGRSRYETRTAQTVVPTPAGGDMRYMSSDISYEIYVIWYIWDMRYVSYESVYWPLFLMTCFLPGVNYS